MLCALVVSHSQADSVGFVRQAYRASSDFARVMPAEETLIGVHSASPGAGRMFWVAVEKTVRPSLAELDALLNPPEPEYESIEEACAEGVAEFPFNGSQPLLSQLPAGHLESVLEQVKGAADARIVVVGHADNVGGDRYNCRLGLKRAEAVGGWFVERGIARERIVIGSQGKREPVADNQSDTGRARNRRASVWIHVMDKGQERRP